MPLASVAALLDVLRRTPFIDPSSFDTLNLRLSAEPDMPLRSAVEDLVAGGHLTFFQAEMILSERGQELVLGQYVLLDRIGVGGMGQVYKARHRRLDRVDAVKVIRSDRLADPESVRRFFREARATARLSHPNLVLVYDADEANGVHYLAMEYVHGTDLDKLVTGQGPLPVRQACEYIRQAALGLQHAHERGLVHRDVKPANLLLVPATGLIKLLDLGLARLRRITDDDDEQQSTDELTRPGTTMGTWDYLSPEQVSDAHTVDIRADIYSLGCTFYYLLTGKPPFADAGPAQKLVCHVMNEPEPAEAARAELPPGLGMVLRRMMAKAPADRYQVPAEVAEVLTRFTHDEEENPSEVPTRKLIPPPSPQPPAPPAPPQRRWRPVAALLLAGMLVVILAWLTPALWRRLGPSKPAPPPEPLVSNTLDMHFVLVPAGMFQMGSPADEPDRDSSELVHIVELTQPFYLGTHEVTQAQYERVTGGNPSWFAVTGNGADAVKGLDTSRFPVEQVSWDDAVEFCRLLGERPEEKQAGRSYRLPTEAEWEYACRAGGSTVFHVGDRLSATQANFAESGMRRPCPVGSYAPNRLGLFDLHGNVSEWCADNYERDYYHISPKEDPRGPAGKRRDKRVLRGGAWNSPAKECRCATRGGGDVDLLINYVGFRIVCIVGKEDRP